MQARTRLENIVIDGFHLWFFPLYFDGRIGLIKLFNARTDIALVTGPPNVPRTRKKEKKNSKRTALEGINCSPMEAAMGSSRRRRGMGYEEEDTEK